MLILRDALHGLTRFDEFQKSLGIAPNMLARRLHALVEAGILERRRYSERPPRHEYLVTARGRDFRPVLIALFAWGNKHFAPEGASVLLIDTKTGSAVDPILVDPSSGRPIEEPEFAFAAGPAAPERTRRRYASTDRATIPGMQRPVHVPQKWEPVLRKRTCSNKAIERDDDSKKSHPALVPANGKRIVRKRSTK